MQLTLRGFYGTHLGSLRITTLHGSLILLGGSDPSWPPLFRTLVQLTNLSAITTTQASDVDVSLNFCRLKRRPRHDGWLAASERISRRTSGPTVTWQTRQLGGPRCHWLPLHDSYFLPSASCALKWLVRLRRDSTVPCGHKVAWIKISSLHCVAAPSSFHVRLFVPPSPIGVDGSIMFRIVRTFVRASGRACR